MKVTIERAPHKQNYTLVSNEVLRFETRPNNRFAWCLYMYLLSYQAEGYIKTTDKLAHHFGVSRKTVSLALGQLEQLGWIRMEGEGKKLHVFVMEPGG